MEVVNGKETVSFQGVWSQSSTSSPIQRIDMDVHQNERACKISHNLVSYTTKYRKQIKTGAMKKTAHF